jgi:thioesterase domain-containing protein/acyl carrier protein
LTIRVNPTNKINIDLRYNSAIVNEEVANYLDNNFYKLGKLLSEYSEKSTLEEVKEKITENKQLHLVKTKDISSIKNRPLLKKSEIKKGRNKSEIALIAIWEKLFNLKPISREDNFFNLGGNSIMALQLFSTIEKQLGEVIAPAVLYKNPTIEDLAEILDGENLSTEEIIIPLKKEGNQPPLFCIHGGGAHVFFYQDLSNNIHRDIPMYSIQPKGLDGKSSKHLSIVEMATDYIKEIKLIQASGPYHLLGTCFSNAVALEMTKQLIAAGDTIGNLFIIDSAPVHLFGNDEEGKSKTMTRFLDMLKRGDFQRIKSKLQRRFSSTTKRSLEKVKKPLNTNEIHLQASIDMLNKLYADYSWEPVDTSIHFIRSSEFHKRSDKKYHLTQWNKLAKKGVSTHVVEGHHISLFQEPEVQGLSRKISKCLLSTK